MSTPNQAARERIVEEHIDTEVRHDLDGLANTFTPESEWRDMPAGETHTGHVGVRASYHDLFTGFPDFSLEVVSKHVARDAIVVEVVATGYHTATWKGVPATGKTVRFPVCAIFTFAADDKIQAETVYYDRLTVLAQLGVTT